MFVLINIRQFSYSFTPLSFRLSCQEMDPLLDHVATLKLAERGKCDDDEDDDGENASLPAPAPPSGSNLDHEAVESSYSDGSMADNDCYRPILPDTAAPLPNHAPTQEVFQFSAMDMDVQSKATQGGHRKQLNHRGSRKIYTSPVKGRCSAEAELRTPPPSQPNVNSSDGVFEFKSTSMPGLSPMRTPHHSRHIGKTEDSYRDSHTQDTDSTATTSPAVGPGGNSSSTLQPESEKSLSPQKDITVSSVMEMEDTTDAVPSTAAAAAHSPCPVNANRVVSQNTFVFGISLSKQQPPSSSSSTTNPSFSSLPFTFSLSSSSSTPLTQPANDGSSVNSSTGTLPFTAAIPKPPCQPTFYFGAGNNNAVTLGTALPVDQPPENDACKSFSSWEEEAEAFKQMQVNHFLPLTRPDGKGDDAGRHTRTKHGDGTEAGKVIRAHSNYIRLRRHSQQQQRVSTSIRSNTTSTTEIAATPQIPLSETTTMNTMVSPPNMEDDIEMHIDPLPDKLLRAWEGQIREETEKNIAEERLATEVTMWTHQIEEVSEICFLFLSLSLSPLTVLMMALDVSV